MTSIAAGGSQPVQAATTTYTCPAKPTRNQISDYYTYAGKLIGGSNPALSFGGQYNVKVYGPITGFNSAEIKNYKDIDTSVSKPAIWCNYNVVNLETAQLVPIGGYYIVNGSCKINNTLKCPASDPKNCPIVCQ